MRCSLVSLPINRDSPRSRLPRMNYKKEPNSRKPINPDGYQGISTFHRPTVTDRVVWRSDKECRVIFGSDDAGNADRGGGVWGLNRRTEKEGLPRPRSSCVLPRAARYSTLLPKRRPLDPRPAWRFSRQQRVELFPVFAQLFTVNTAGAAVEAACLPGEEAGRAGSLLAAAAAAAVRSFVARAIVRSTSRVVHFSCLSIPSPSDGPFPYKHSASGTTQLLFRRCYRHRREATSEQATAEPTAIQTRPRTVELCLQVL